MKAKLTKITLLLLVLVIALTCVVACGKDKTYKITVMDGETEIATFDVKSGEALSREDVLAKVQKAGYEFVGLYTDPELTEAFVHEDEILSEITLYAKYTQKTLYIKVKQGDGESEVAKVEVKNGEAYEVPVPTKEGYEFAGYTYLNDDEDEVAFPTTGTYHFSTDIRLTAHWTKKTFVVTFKNGDESAITTQSGIEYGAKASRITLNGYTIEGYYLDKEFTNENKINLATYEIKAATTIYVKKTANTYKITVAGWHEATIDVTYGAAYALVSPEDTTNAIYTAKIGTGADNEWGTFSGYTYNNQEFPATGTYTYAENITVLPIYTLNPNYDKATVTFWDTVNNVVFTTVRVSCGTTVATTEFPNAEKTGYAFGGWFSNSTYTQESTFTSGVQVNENMDVYAKYTANAHTITVKDTNADGATLATIPVTFGQAFSIADPGKYGFSFDGYLWGTEPFDPDDYDTYNIDEDIVLFATFTQIDTGSDLFVMDAENGYFKERASVSDPFTYVFLTGVHYTFAGYTLSSTDNTAAITPDDTGFTANSPAAFELKFTANAGGAEITVPAKVVNYIKTFALGGSYTAMLINAKKGELFKDNLAQDSDYVMTAGVTNFKPELVITNKSNASVSFENADVLVEMKNATGGALNGSYVWNGSSFDFDNTGNVFTAEEKVTLTFKPKYALTPFASSLTVKFNTAVNVYTNEELRAQYSNSNVHEINVLRNITAVLEQAEYLNNGTYGTTKTITMGSTTNPNGSVYTLENWDAGGPKNRFGGGVYRRTVSGVQSNDTISDSIVINGNYFTIDGSRLPYIAENDRSSRTSGNSYMLSNVQIGIFLYRCGEVDGSDSYDDMTGVKWKSGHVSFNNLRIVGNNKTEMADAVVKLADTDKPLLKMSSSLNGITIRGGTLTMDNTTISNVGMGMMLHGSVNGVYKPTANNDAYGFSTNLIMRKSMIDKCWANDIYCYDLCGLTFENSYFGGCSGAAIHFDDRPYAATSYIGSSTDTSSTQGFSDLNSSLTMDDATARSIQNWVNGEGAWFVAYNQTTNAAKIKTTMEGGLDYYLQRSILNNGYMNFAILVFPTNDNAATWQYDNEQYVSIVDHSTEVSAALASAGVTVVKFGDMEYACYAAPGTCPGLKLYLPIVNSYNN